MKILIDTEQQTINCEDGDNKQSLSLYSKAGFELLSDLWVKVGWNEKYSYTFSWMGRPIIQLPEDIIRIQEVIYAVKPDVIIETGVAHGGTMIFYASLCKAMGKGRVIGIDIEIREHNRKAIEEHDLASYITLFEGSSTAPELVNEVKKNIEGEKTVLVILDSDHSKKHVADELEAYCDMVSSGSYIVATDGLMKDVHDVPRGTASWIDDNPTDAAIEFAARRSDFVLEQPPWPFNESELEHNITHWPSAWLRKR